MSEVNVSIAVIAVVWTAMVYLEQRQGDSWLAAVGMIAIPAAWIGHVLVWAVVGVTP